MCTNVNNNYDIKFCFGEFASAGSCDIVFSRSAMINLSPVKIGPAGLSIIDGHPSPSPSPCHSLGPFILKV